MNRWHITVKEPEGMGRPYERRFAFDTAQEALACYVSALSAGFEVQVRQVRKVVSDGYAKQRQ